MPYRGSDAVGGNLAALSVTVPAATQVGDLLLAFVSSSDTGAPSTPSGWTLADQTTASTLLDTLYTRVAQSGDAGSTLTVTLAAANRATLLVVAWSGVDTAVIFDPATPAETTTLVTTDHATVPGATLTAECEVLARASERGSTATAWTALGGSWTGVQSVFASGAGQTSGSVSSATLPAGTVSPTDWYIDATTNKFVGRLLVLAPVAVSPPSGVGDFRTLTRGEQLRADLDVGPLDDLITLEWLGEPPSGDVTGTGAATAPAAVASGTGSLTITGAGAVAAPVATASGTGTTATPVTGAGAVAAPAASAAGTGVLAITATGATTAAPATASGAGSLSITAAGAVAAPAATVTATAVLTVTASASVAPSPPVIAATAVLTLTGSGAAHAPPAIAAGTGALTITGVGAVTAPPATATGAGGIGAIVTATGAVTAAPAQASGTAALTLTATGAGQAPPPSAAGIAALTVTGTGGPVAPAGSATGLAALTVTGTGAVVAPAVTVTGTGTVSGAARDVAPVLTGFTGHPAVASLTGRARPATGTGHPAAVTATRRDRPATITRAPITATLTH